MVEFTKLAEARELRETLAILATHARDASKPKEEVSVFPPTLLGQADTLPLQQFGSPKDEETTNGTPLRP
jgi:hypothetical protein